MTHLASVHKRCNKVLKLLTNPLRDEEKMQVMSSVFIAGGSVVHSDDQPNDYDVFFTNPEALRLVATNFWANSLTRQETLRVLGEPIQLDDQLTTFNLDTEAASVISLNIGRQPSCSLHSRKAIELEMSHISGNAITLKSRIQIVTRFVGSVEAVLNTFDFEHCKVAWTPSLINPLGGRIQYFGESQRAIAEKVLLYQPHSRFVLSAFKRLEKFIKRGYSIPVSTIINMKESLDALDLSDPEVLNRELSTYYGVDAQSAKRISEFCTGVDGRINLETLKQISEGI